MTTVERSSAVTWNFFRRTDEPELWCAVDALDSVPGFLLSGDWRFSGHRLGRQTQPPGFNANVASQSGRLNGFYLFHLIARHHEAV